MVDKKIDSGGKGVMTRRQAAMVVGTGAALPMVFSPTTSMANPFIWAIRFGGVLLRAARRVMSGLLGGNRARSVAPKPQTRVLGASPRVSPKSASRVIVEELATEAAFSFVFPEERGWPNGIDVVALREERAREAERYDATAIWFVDEFNDVFVVGQNNTSEWIRTHLVVEARDADTGQVEKVNRLEVFMEPGDARSYRTAFRNLSPGPKRISAYLEDKPDLAFVYLENDYVLVAHWNEVVLSGNIG